MYSNLRRCRASADGPSVLNIALDGQPEHLDVAMSSMDIASEVVFGPVYEKLVAFNGENHVIPELAESWELTEENSVKEVRTAPGCLGVLNERCRTSLVV